MEVVTLDLYEFRIFRFVSNSKQYEQHKWLCSLLEYLYSTVVFNVFAGFSQLIPHNTLVCARFRLTSIPMYGYTNSWKRKRTWRCICAAIVVIVAVFCSSSIRCYSKWVQFKAEYIFHWLNTANISWMTSHRWK